VAFKLRHYRQFVAAFGTGTSRFSLWVIGFMTSAAFPMHREEEILVSVLFCPIALRKKSAAGFSILPVATGA